MTEITVTDGAGITEAMSAAYRNRAWAPQGLASDPLGSTTIRLPAGTYWVRDIRGLMGAEGTASKVRGLRFQGAGSDLTHVIFDPPAPGALAFNQYWQNIHMEGITFSVTRPDCTFMHTVANTGSAVQEYTFTDVKWSGPWKYGFNLQGGNNNSEYRFFGCGTTQMQADGAFLYVGTDNTSDQFLNYWFYGFKHWSTSASLIDAARGGHFHFYGVDVSAWGGDLTAPRYLFNLRGKSHSAGVQTFTANGLRVEAKNGYAGLLNSEWGDGNVSIQCDWSSQTFKYVYGDIINIDLSNVSGPTYNFHDSNLAGGVRVQWASATWVTQPAIRFRDCVWRQRLTPSEVVKYVVPADNYAAFTPPVEFVGCRGEEQNAARGGASVWDATVGHATASLVQPAQPRVLTVRGVRGAPAGAETTRVHLPVGAIITGLAPINSTGTWVAETSTGEHAATTYEPGAPFHCDTRGKATITIRETTGAPMQRGGFLTLAGYW